MNNPIVQREACCVRNNYGGVPPSSSRNKGNPSRPALVSTSSKGKDGLGEDEKNDTLCPRPASSSSGTTHNLSATDACVHNYSTRPLAGGEALRNADDDDADNSQYTTCIYNNINSGSGRNDIKGGDDNYPLGLRGGGGDGRGTRLWAMHKRWEWTYINRNRIPHMLNSSVSVHERVAFWNEANAYAGIDPWERSSKQGSSNHPACKQWMKYNGLDPMLEVNGTAANHFGDLAHSPSELVELCIDLAYFQKPYLLAMGLLNEDDDPIAVVPVFDGKNRVDWQNSLSPKMRVFMEQITNCRLSKVSQRQDGDLRDILIKQGYLCCDNEEIYKQFLDNLWQRVYATNASHGEEDRILVKSCYTAAFRRWVGQNVDFEWPTADEAIHQFIEWLPTGDNMEMLRQTLLHGLVQRDLVDTVIKNKDVACEHWRESHKNDEYVTTLSERVEQGRTCESECDCRMHGLSNELTTELHHVDEEAKRRWKCTSGNMRNPSRYDEIQMDDQLPSMVPLCRSRHRYHSRKGYETGRIMSALQFLRRYLTRALVKFVSRSVCFMSKRDITSDNWEQYDCHHPFEKHLLQLGENLLDTGKNHILSEMHKLALTWESYKQVLFREVIRIIMIDARLHNPIIHWALKQGQQFLGSIGAWYPYKIVPLSKEDTARAKEVHGKDVVEIMTLSDEDADAVEEKHGVSADAIINDILFRGGALHDVSTVPRPVHYLDLLKNDGSSVVVEQTNTNPDGWKLTMSAREEGDNGPQLSDEDMSTLQNEKVCGVPSKSDLATSFMMSILSRYDDDQEEDDSVGICPSLQKQSTASLLQRPCVGDDNGLAPELLALWNRSMTLSTRIKVAHHRQFTGSKELAALFPDRRRDRDTQFGMSKEALESWSNSREGAQRRKKKKQEPVKSASVTFPPAGWMPPLEEVERQREEYAARMAELRMEARKEKEEDDARRRIYAQQSDDVYNLDKDFTQWTTQLVPISESEAEKHLHRIGCETPRPLSTMKTPADPEECINARNTITLKEWRPNTTTHAKLGRKGLGLQSSLISRELGVISLTALVFGSGHSESVGCTLNISMKKAPHEHAVYIDGRKVDMEVGMVEPLFGNIISFYGPTRFAYRVIMSSEKI